MSMHFFPRALCALAASLVLAGCSLAPVHQRPQAPIPTQWPQQDAAPVLSSSAATLDWNSFIADRQLRQLVDLAQAHNRDLRQTLLNVEAARALYQVQRADRLPGVGLQGGGTRQRLPGDMNATGQPQVQGSWQAGLGLAAFELDLFGRVRNLSEAALGEYLATEEAARAARISLGAEVVQAYLSRDGALRRLQLAQRTLQSRESSLRLTAQRRQAGTATALDHQDALGLAAQARADVERSERELRQAGNALLLLTGVEDLGPYLSAQSARSAGSAQSAKSSDVPMLLQDLSAGTPSELLIHRPDIQAAEHRLRARSADIGAARAAFFPRISLTGFLGSSSADLSDLFRSGQRAWSFTPRSRCPSSTGGATAPISTWPCCARTWPWQPTSRPSRPPSAKWPTPWPPPTRCAARKPRAWRCATAAAKACGWRRPVTRRGWTTICATWTPSATPSPMKAPTSIP